MPFAQRADKRALDEGKCRPALPSLPVMRGTSDVRWAGWLKSETRGLGGDRVASRRCFLLPSRQAKTLPLSRSVLKLCALTSPPPARLLPSFYKCTTAQETLTSASQNARPFLIGDPRQAGHGLGRSLGAKVFPFLLRSPSSLPLRYRP